MADQKISDLTAKTTIASTDLLPLVDEAGTPTTKKITARNFFLGKGAAIFVAASDASASEKLVADYICDGTGDESEINSALSALLNSKGKVLLSTGTFSSQNPVNLTTSQTLEGQGMDATNIVGSANTFNVIHMGNRQSDGIMRNYMGLSDLSVSSTGGANNFDTVWADGMGNGSFIKNVKASEGKYNFRLTDLDQCSLTNIKGFNPRTASIYCEVGLENTWGNVAFYSPSAALSDNNTTAWLFDANSNQASPNKFDRVSIYGGLLFSTAGLTGTTGLKMTVGATAFAILGTLFENNITHILLSGQTFMTLMADSFIQNSGVSTNIVQLQDNSHTVSSYDCRFQQSTNGFNGVSGGSHIGFFGKNTNQGNITNLITGSFNSKYGTDTVFAGNGNLALGLNNDRFDYVFANKIVGSTSGSLIGESGGASGEKWGFWGASPIVQPVLATGAAKTVDDVITVLQTLGLARQS